jgi:hypothetical protein
VNRSIFIDGPLGRARFLKYALFPYHCATCNCKPILDGAIKVQYLRYTRFLRISRTDKYAACFGNRASLDPELFTAPSENLFFTKPSIFSGYSKVRQRCPAVNGMANRL